MLVIPILEITATHQFHFPIWPSASIQRFAEMLTEDGFSVIEMGNGW
ncbi:MAG: hypothetical protein F6J90_37975 [Moorea sp. SIOASIH]|nr:hypothetical protein [Moorena sp. SIOASIH]NEO41805.1 hypothetical protein [Moorena sp. SIOASIH]